MPRSSPPLIPSPAPVDAPRHPFLLALGERVRAIRSRRGMTRKAVAHLSKVSERHLANLESGSGNASVLVLLQLAGALQCSVSELLGDVTTLSTEWLMIRALLENQDEATLARVRVALSALLGPPATSDLRAQRVALVGLRGAGKSSLGARLALDLGVPFVEFSDRVASFAGCSVPEIHALYGVNAYRRYERRALEAIVEEHDQVVMTIPGGLVSEAATFSLLLARTHTVWLKARPEDHMSRVSAQGDTRPMAASLEAMDDLKRILEGRTSAYSKAAATLDTSVGTFEESAAALLAIVRAQLLGAQQK